MRDRLAPHARAILDHRITVVTAGAGYGKSTCVAQACAYLKVPKVWYRLDESDRDPVNFVSYIVAGIEKSVPRFGDSIIPRMDASVSGGVSKALLTSLLSSMESALTEPFVIVLDDVHAIEDSSDISEILMFFLTHLPESVHCVLISRAGLTLPLSRFRARLELHEIDQSELAFSMDEIVILFRQLFGFDIPEKSLRNLEGKTEGWVSGLILFYQLSKDKPFTEVEALLGSIRGNHTVFSDYMAENVFTLLPAASREFLLNTAIFNQMDTEFCNRFLTIDNAAELLSELEARRLFTQSLDDERSVYCYHHLFLEFLRNRLTREKSDDEVKTLHHRAAVLFEEDGNIDEALNHYIFSGDYDDVFRLLGDNGKKLFLQGRHKTLDGILRRIPESYHLTEPWLPAFKSMIFTSEGELTTAVHYNRIAHDLFVQKGMAEAAETQMMELARIWYLIGEFPKSEAVFENILSKGAASAANRLESLGHLIFITAATGKTEASNRWFRQAEEELQTCNKDMYYIDLVNWIMLNQAFSQYFRGDIERALFYCESVAEEIKTSGSLMLLGYYYHIASIAYIARGDLQRSRNAVDSGITMLQESCFQGMQEAWLHLSSAILHLVSGNYEAVEPALNRGEEIFKKGGSRWGEASMIVIRAIYYFNSGEREKAIACMTDGFSIASEFTIPWVEAKLYSFAALGMIRNNTLDNALPLIDHAESIIHFSEFEMCHLFLLRAFWHHRKGDAKEARRYALQAIENVQKNNYGTWIFFGIEDHIPFLVDAYSSGRFQTFIRSMFIDHGSRYQGVLQQIARKGDRRLKVAATDLLRVLPKTETPPLRIYCLGRFRVFVGDREIESKEWKSTKARDILKYLTVFRNRGPVNKEVLMELIWPDEDAEKTQKRLHVALPALRKTLEPDVKRGESSYLARDKETYQLSIGNGGSIDIEQFMAEVALADKETDPKKALDRLLTAESLYTGELFADDLYAEWCFDERERLNRRYLQVVFRILSIYESVSDVPRSVEYAEKYLATDPYAEEIYLKLMRLYHTTGNGSMVIKTMEKCRHFIEEDLGCPLSDEVLSFYDRFAHS